MPPLLPLPRLLFSWISLLCVCVLWAPAQAKARKLTLPQHDLELEVPDDWKRGPASDYAAAVLHNPPRKGETLGTKTAVLLVTPIASGVHIDKAEFVASTRRLIEEKKGLIVGRGFLTLEPLSFVTTTISEKLVEHPRTYMCTTFANDRAVTLMLSSKEGDPTDDPDLASILNSLHFLSPLRPVAELTFWDKARHVAARHVLFLSAVGLLAAAALVALVILLKRRRASAVRRDPVPSR